MFLSFFFWFFPFLKHSNFRLLTISLYWVWVELFIFVTLVVLLEELEAAAMAIAASPELFPWFGDGSAELLLLLLENPATLTVAEGQSWASMSTRQIGQCLFNPSHWSTQVTWNKCMQGKRRTSSSSSNSVKKNYTYIFFK